MANGDSAQHSLATPRSMHTASIAKMQSFLNVSICGNSVEWTQGKSWSFLYTFSNKYGQPYTGPFMLE